MAFQGVYTAIVTPFIRGELDLPSLTRVVENQLEAEIDGLVVCGTTGESATLSQSEVLAVTRHVLDVSKGSCKVIAGVGTNQTSSTIELLNRSAELDIDGALVITPYYNKPSQSGLEAHFCSVSEAANTLPLMLYTVPSRTGVHLSVDTFTRLARLPNVVSLKDATADLALSAEYIAAADNQAEVFSGDDITALPLWSVGGAGVVSVAANLYPSMMVRMWRAFKSLSLSDAQAMHHRLLPIFRGLFLESNPSPVKYLMAKQHLIESDTLRLPLVPISEQTASVLLSHHEVIKQLEGNANA